MVPTGSCGPTPGTADGHPPVGSCWSPRPAPVALGVSAPSSQRAWVNKGRAWALSPEPRTRKGSDGTDRLGVTHSWLGKNSGLAGRQPHLPAAAVASTLRKGSFSEVGAAAATLPWPTLLHRPFLFSPFLFLFSPFFFLLYYCYYYY